MCLCLRKYVRVCDLLCDCVCVGVRLSMCVVVCVCRGVDFVTPCECACQ